MVGDAVDRTAASRLERTGERIGIEHVDMQDVDEAALAGEPVGGAPHLLGQVRHEACWRRSAG